VAAAMRLFGSLTQHLQSLIALAGIEGREATALYIKIAIALGAALFFASIGYILLLFFIAFALERWLHAEWIWIALGLAVAHLLAALAGGLYIKRNFRAPVFRGTIAEIRKDVASLRGTGNPPLL
jgi:uncharacterized membrane protein YqjE